jgi:hypothetical protein
MIAPAASGFQNFTFTASRSASLVTSNNAAALKLNMPAMMLVGKTSRWLL